jgi:hypothetical protein
MVQQAHRPQIQARLGPCTFVENRQEMGLQMAHQSTIHDVSGLFRDRAAALSGDYNFDGDISLHFRSISLRREGRDETACCCMFQRCYWSA